jgi:hypothetical protein
VKPAEEVIARLRERDLYDLCADVARVYRIPLEEICNGSRQSDIVEARHAVWLKIYHWFGGNLSATARLFGVDHTSVLHAVRTAPPQQILRVVFATFESGEHAYELLWFAGRVNPFGIQDRMSSAIMWFPTYDLAHAAFVEFQEQAGAPTFHARSIAQLGGAP